MKKIEKLDLCSTCIPSKKKYIVLVRHVITGEITEIIKSFFPELVAWKR